MRVKVRHQRGERANRARWGMRIPEQDRLMLIACRGNRKLAAFLKKKGYRWRRCGDLNRRGTVADLLTVNARRPFHDMCSTFAFLAFGNVLMIPAEDLPLHATLDRVVTVPDVGDSTSGPPSVRVTFWRYGELMTDLLEYHGTR